MQQNLYLQSITKSTQCHSASKAASDLLVRSYVETFGFPATITRCSNNYGPYQFPEKLIPLMIHNVASSTITRIR